MAISKQPDYEPPTSSEIARRQNDTDAIRLLLAQRHLYSKAKIWQSLRWVGLILIGLAAPLVTLIWPTAAIIIFAVAATWLFLGRTLFSWLESKTMTRAATIQEDLDLYVFGMPVSIERSSRPSLEDIARLAGQDADLTAAAKKERLFDWYPIDATITGTASIAIAQRANAEYSHRLLRRTLVMWAIVTSVWAVVLVVIGIVIGLSAATIALGVVLPILPPALDIVEYLRGVSRAARDRGDLARTIEGHINSGTPIPPSDLLVWQDRMFDLRRTTPQIPDWLYKFTRKKNEAAMHTAATQLAKRSKRGGR